MVSLSLNFSCCSPRLRASNARFTNVGGRGLLPLFDTNLGSGPPYFLSLSPSAKNVSQSGVHSEHLQTRMWANAQRDGRPAEYGWRPVLNAAKFASRPLLDCRAVTLPIEECKTWRTLS